MHAKIQKWGNSQGIRFSKAILRQACVVPGADVDISVRGSEIIVKPVAALRGKYRLRDLLERMPEKHEPSEVDWGKPQGQEAW
ncbi:MAG: transcriptional regulator/antitoxin, MazE [Fibrobacterota bacterium]